MYENNNSSTLNHGSTRESRFARDEELAEEVRKYPVLYDKSSPHYKDKRKVENAWKLVDEQLGFEEGEQI